MTETQTKDETKKDRVKPSVQCEGSLPDQHLTTPKAPEPCSDKCPNAAHPPRTRLPMYDGQNEAETIGQQRPSCEYEAEPRVMYDGFDPGRRSDENMPKPSVAGDDIDYIDEDYDPPYCNDFHDSHMDVHKEFWEIIDSCHECNFCHKFCTVMRCPNCDVQACSYCKDKYG